MNRIAKIHRQFTNQYQSSFVDLRSDTLSTPTPTMLANLVQAQVGDDSYKEDPTVIKLQNKMASLFQKQAAIYVPTTTMANTISLKYALDQKQAKNIYYSSKSHINITEKKGLQWLLPQLQWHPILSNTNNLDTTSLQNYIQLQKDTKGIFCIENPTFDGQVLSLEYLEQIRQIKQNFPNLHYHLDGARVFDAISYYFSYGQSNNIRKFNLTQTDTTTIKEILNHDLFQTFDTISVCFSKGMCCPMGSIILGTKEFVDHAFNYRKYIGGATRQAGYMAATALQSLEEIAPNLVKSHNLAKYTFDKLKSNKNIQILQKPDINMLFLKVNNLNATELQNTLKNDYKILVKPYKNNEFIRIVYHFHHETHHSDSIIQALLTIAENTK